jgi:Ca2+-binding EF-hand superfamily protein
LKHKEVSTLAELKKNQFSSYRYVVKKFGEETAQELVRSVINIGEDKEGMVDMGELKRTKTKLLPWAT